MSNLPELPVEVWQKILRHSMFVPDFLDPASFEGTRAFESRWFAQTRYSKDDEAVYWKIERRRNVLRLVCQTWNAYCNLPQFQHRFVRMDDIWHQRIGDEALETAIRIDFLARWCGCYEICRAARESGESEQYQPFCYRKIASLDCKRFQIAGMMGTVIETFSSSTLVSLSVITLETGTPTIFNWNLPSLRHFRVHPIFCEPSSTFIGNVVIPILRVVGSQLRSLYVGNMAIEDAIPGEIWVLCPLLERLHPGGGLEVAPPISHPIHTVSIHLVSIRRSLLKFPTSIIRWPNLQKVIIDAQWDEVFPEYRQYVWTRWKDEWKSTGIVLEDVLETRLESYMESNA